MSAMLTDVRYRKSPLAFPNHSAGQCKAASSGTEQRSHLPWKHARSAARPGAGIRPMSTSDRGRARRPRFRCSLRPPWVTLALSQSTSASRVPRDALVDHRAWRRGRRAVESSFAREHALAQSGGRARFLAFVDATTPMSRLYMGMMDELEKLGGDWTVPWEDIEAPCWPRLPRQPTSLALAPVLTTSAPGTRRTLSASSATVASSSWRSSSANVRRDCVDGGRSIVKQDTHRIVRLQVVQRHERVTGCPISRGAEHTVLGIAGAEVDPRTRPWLVAVRGKGS